MSSATARDQEERKLKCELTSEERPDSDRSAAQARGRSQARAHDRGFRPTKIAAALAAAGTARARNLTFRTVAPALILAAGALAPAVAQAAAPLSWSKPVSVDPGQTPSAIACPSENLCVAVDRGGQVLRTTSPPASPNPTWQAPHAIDPGHALTALACAPAVPASLCVAGDESGGVVVSTDPEAGAGGWRRTSIDSQALTGVACPSAKLCIAVDQAGSALASIDPGASDAEWTATDIDAGHQLRAVSCPSESLCVAVDDAGRVLTSTDPGAASPSWKTRAIDAIGELVAVSCASTQLCVAVDGAGNALASPDPEASAPTWSSTPVPFMSVPTSISCASSGLCVSVDEGGSALASDDPASGLPAWSESSADPGMAITSVACVPDGVCMAIDGAGAFVRATVAAPLAITGSASEITPSEATLVGTVNPQDAVLGLGQCTFEYGPTAGYGLTAACSSQPSAVGGQQTVQARVSTLSAASTYHFRIVAANAGGQATGADGTFTTAPAVSVVRPSPYILGVPANGVRLYCQPGTSGSATLTYAWIRDATVVASATSSTYVVSGADAQHHLQCRVTATNAAGSATASSGFVAVPAMGVLAATGETNVGKVSASATAIAIPLTCSAQAPAGCAISVHVTTRQARTSGKGKQARHVTVTVTLAGATAHLKRGERRTLTLPLSAAGRRLLVRAHRLTATVSVTGTVIGELKATLANLVLTLRDPPAGGHAARRERATHGKTASRPGSSARTGVSTRGHAARRRGSRDRVR